MNTDANCASTTVKKNILRWFTQISLRPGAGSDGIGAAAAPAARARHSRATAPRVAGSFPAATAWEKWHAIYALQVPNDD